LPSAITGIAASIFMKFNFFKIKIKTNIKILLLLLLFFALFFFQPDNTESPNVLAESSFDAIAVRVVPNSNHYSPLLWYEKQGFSGSPQSLTVDGYEAAREGRTVYVNVANISDSNEFYTNIYLISYNQNAEQETLEIFSRLISSWKFNYNIFDAYGAGECSLTNTKKCIYNSDCPLGEYCQSQKAKIIRDTKRLADLAKVKINLEIASSTNGYYPKLEAGTYLPGRTISVWPSWQEELAEELDIIMPVDPINKMGECCPATASYCNQTYNYNITTCWDEDNKSFAGTIDISNPLLPSNSLVYTYSTDSEGLTYRFCAVLETGYTNLVTPPVQTYCITGP